MGIYQGQCQKLVIGGLSSFWVGWTRGNNEWPIAPNFSPGGHFWGPILSSIPPQHSATSLCGCTPILASLLGALVRIYWQLWSVAWESDTPLQPSQDTALSILPSHLTACTQLLHLKMGTATSSQGSCVRVEWHVKALCALKSKCKASNAKFPQPINSAPTSSPQRVHPWQRYKNDHSSASLSLFPAFLFTAYCSLVLQFIESVGYLFIVCLSHQKFMGKDFYLLTNCDSSPQNYTWPIRHSINIFWTDEWLFSPRPHSRWGQGQITLLGPTSQLTTRKKVDTYSKTETKILFKHNVSWTFSCNKETWSKTHLNES